jgi:peptide-methionine (R)-S-oxide reductase
MTNKTLKTNKEWREELPADLYHIAREKGTESPFTGKYTHEKRPGQYLCACCGEALFNAETKYDSGSGWPSFTAPAAAQAVAEHTDSSHGMQRTEVTCSQCGAHLGHVFPDGPAENGLRYCINSRSLKHEQD